MQKGLFITVDGPNGAGKTTLIDSLAKKCSSIVSVFTTREPTETSFGRFVKKNEQNLSGLPYARLVWSDRCFHIQNFVLPQIDLGKLVISDRYIESSFVLQGFDGVPTEQIWEMNKDFIVPSISVILLADSDVLERRLSERSFLTNFEKRMTREEEVEAYIKTAGFLEEKGFCYLFCRNNTLEDLVRNVDEVFDRIASLMR